MGAQSFPNLTTTGTTSTVTMSTSIVTSSNNVATATTGLSVGQLLSNTLTTSLTSTSSESDTGQEAEFSLYGDHTHTYGPTFLYSCFHNNTSDCASANSPTFLTRRNTKRQRAEVTNCATIIQFSSLDFMLLCSFREVYHLVSLCLLDLFQTSWTAVALTPCWLSSTMRKICQNPMMMMMRMKMTIRRTRSTRRSW